MNFKAIRTFLTVLVALPVVARAADDVPSFGLPLDCAFGETCQVTRYVDNDASPNILDYGCGTLTADGYPGTDFTLRDATVMEQGVAVLAIAPGTVTTTHDGADDIGAAGAEQALLTGTGCGNAVLVDHGAGWVSEYCHLKKGSLTVKTGDKVEIGAPLGQVGLSGATNTPHLHLRVRYLNAVIDPFRDFERRMGCGGGGNSLWSEEVRAALVYQPFVVLNAGFTMGQPKKEDARAGRYAAPTLPNTAPALAFWLEVAGLNAGDAVAMHVTGPDGETVLSGTKTMEKNRASWFGWIGKKRDVRPWPNGTYTARVKLVRPGRSLATVVEKTRTLEITP